LLPSVDVASSGSASGDERAVRADQARMFTARATTSPTVTNDSRAWASIAIFARPDSGIASVGLNAVEFVKLTYR
jgi:hypothetical protein